MNGISKCESTVLLADADVLIDYRDSDLSVLKLVGEHIAPVAVLSCVLDEVTHVTRRDCRRMGIKVISPETDLLLLAGQLQARVSFNDRLGFVVCRQNGWTCVTNDRALRQLCSLHDVSTRYGLRLMLDLVARGVLTHQQAIIVARQIHASNPMHINDRIVARFVSALARIRHRPRQ